jgi:tetratricopeptide (TPR) repeat protein
VASRLDSLLSILVRKELIRPHPATLQDDEAFRFRHLLIRDAAYDALPKATRAELHQRFALWLEDSADGVIELDEIAGWHLEQAVRYRHELDHKLDPALAQRAATHLHAAGRAGDESLRSQALGWYAGSIIYGPQHTCAAVQALDEIEREEPGPYLATRLAFRRGQLARLEGHFNASRQLIQRAIDGFYALGMPQHVAGCEQDLANTELAAGHPAAALAALLRSDEILAQRGERSYRGTTQALLAQTHELIGNHQAALAALDLVDELDPREDVLDHAITHPVRARLALAAGDSDAAERWARSAVEHALLTDNTVLQADATLNLARVLSTIGQRDNATSQARAALDLFLSKGDKPGAEKTHALLHELASTA